MAVFGNQNYTSFQAVNIKGSVALRVGGYDTNQGTVWIASATLESPRAWGLPDKSGTFGVSGTFSVSLASISAASYLQTVVTVSGIRVEDGLVVNAHRGSASDAIRPVLTGATPGNGNITLYFINPFATASSTLDLVTFGYTAVR